MNFKRSKGFVLATLLFLFSHPRSLICQPVQFSPNNNCIPIEVNIGPLFGPAGASFNMECYYFRQLKLPTLPYDIELPPVDWKIGIGCWSGKEDDIHLRDKYLLAGVRTSISGTSDFMLWGEMALACHLISGKYQLLNSRGELSSSAIRYGERFSIGIQYERFENWIPSIAMGFDIVPQTNTFFINTQVRYLIPSYAHQKVKEAISYLGL